VTASSACRRADVFRSPNGPPRNTTMAPEKLCISTQSDTGAQGPVWPAVGCPRNLKFRGVVEFKRHAAGYIRLSWIRHGARKELCSANQPQTASCLASLDCRSVEKRGREVTMASSRDEVELALRRDARCMRRAAVCMVGVQSMAHHRASTR
jgi:hypothetical protein